MSQLLSVKRVANGRFQAEMADFVERQGRINVLRHLNKGDAAFEGTARHCWFPVTIESLREMGISEDKLKAIDATEQGGKVELNIKNPSISGEVLRIQINETTEGTEYQKANWKKAAKQLEINDRVLKNATLAKANDIEKYLGKRGYFVTEEGKLIFSNATVTIESQLNHSFEEGMLVPEGILAGYAQVLAEPATVAETAPAM